MNEKTLHEQLVKIQQTLKVSKNNTNEFGHYKYRSCEDILEAVKPILGELSLILTDEIVNLGSRYYVKATANLSDGKTNMRVEAFARESEDKKGMDDAQITGATSSYARKYALNGLFAIDDTKDADTMDNTASQPVKPITVSEKVGECPKCGADLLRKQKKDGSKYFKCSMGGWDSIKGTPVGCDFVDWGDGT